MPTLRWIGGVDGHLRLIDQTRLPVELRRDRLPRRRDGVGGHQDAAGPRGPGHRHRGGLRRVPRPANGRRRRRSGRSSRRLDEVTDYLATSRPTAVNLFWALDRMKQKAAERCAARCRRPRSPPRCWPRPGRSTRKTGRCAGRSAGTGPALLRDGQGVLTHCNAGGLATADYGTALAVFFAAAEAGKRLHVFADETRPLLQGARLTAWELQQRGIDVTLICDNDGRPGDARGPGAGGGHRRRPHRRQRRHGQQDRHLRRWPCWPPPTASRSTSPRPAARSTCRSPAATRFPIEQRDPREVTHGFGRQTAPEGIEVYNPAFDVTPARLITAIISERGIIRAGHATGSPIGCWEPPSDPSLPTSQSPSVGKRSPTGFPS